MSIRGLASAAVVLAVTTLAACGDSPTAPDYLPGLVVQAETAA